jgi:hypothetical protein
MLRLTYDDKVALFKKHAHLAVGHGVERIFAEAGVTRREVPLR